MSKHNNNSGSSTSLWMEIALPEFPMLQENLHVDVCIVGAGIVGLTCAYTLLKAGKTVALIDQGDIGGGQTARSTAQLTWVLDNRYFEIERLFGKEGMKLAFESHSAAIDYIEEIIRNEKIDCDFERVDAYLFVPPKESKEILNKELESLHKINSNAKKVPQAPFKDFDTGTCLHFSNQAKFHALKYLKGLIEAILKLGGKLFSQTPVSQIEDGTPCLAKTTLGYHITSDALIVATCTPFNDRFFIHTKQAAYRTYVIAGLIPKDSVPNALYWDTADPYHYISVQKHLTNPKLHWLLIGGEDHRTGQDPDVEKRYARLKKWAKKRFPMIEEFEYQWSGQIFEPVDSLAFIGRNPGDQHIYIATGDSGNGLTHGTIAGLLLPELIAGKNHQWESLYSPSRKSLKAVSEYLKENITSLWQYKDWLTPEESKKIESLKQEEGVLLREGIKKIAVFKDINGVIHSHSAYCPHLGGCLQWNSGEKSWDCPVHGSRFSGCGKFQTGPACGDLYCTNLPID